MLDFNANEECLCLETDSDIPSATTSSPYNTSSCSDNILNDCCRSFNCAVFLSPPKIRDIEEGSTCTYSPGAPIPSLINEQPLQEKPKRLALKEITNEIPSLIAQKQSKLPESKCNFQFPDGGWVCSACRNYNFMGRSKCNRCGKIKSKEDSDGKPSHIAGIVNENAISSCDQSASSKRRKKLKERAGDWVCFSCKNLNFAFRTECNRCKLSKSQSTAVTQQYLPYQNECFQQPFCVEGHFMQNMDYYMGYYNTQYFPM